MKQKRYALPALLAALALMLSLFSVAAVCSYAAGENLLSDGLTGIGSRRDNGDGFTVQDLIDNDQWYGWGDRSTAEAGHGGKKAMQVARENSIGANAYDYAYVKLPAGKYVYSAWIKTEQFQGANVWLNVDVFSTDVLGKQAQLNTVSTECPPLQKVENKIFYNLNGENKFLTEDWKQYTTEFTLDTEAVVRINFGVQYSWGTILASDFAVTAVADEPADDGNLLSAGLTGIGSRRDNGDGFTVQDLIDNDQWYGWGDRSTAEAGHGGKKAMQVAREGSIGANAYDYAYVKLPAGKYTYSAWIKTEQFQGANVWLNVDVFSTDVLGKQAQLNTVSTECPPLQKVENKIFYNLNGENKFSTEDWKQYTTEFTLDTEAVVRINFGVQYSWGTILASDFAVRAVKEGETSDPSAGWELDEGELLSGEQIYLANRGMNVEMADTTVAQVIETGKWYGWGQQGKDENGHGGKPAMKGSYPSLGDNSFDFTFVRLPAGKYELSVWVKTEQFQAAVLGLYVDSYGLDVLDSKAKLEDFTAPAKRSLQNNIFYGMNSRDEFSTADWTKYTFHFALDEESVVRLQAVMRYFRGDVWMSDFSLKPFDGDINEDKYEDGNLLTKRIVGCEQWKDNSDNMTETVDFMIDNDYWYGWGSHGSIDKDNGHGGKPAQKVEAVIIGGNMYRYTYVKLEPGTYRFSAWIKTEEFCGALLYLGARVYNNDVGDMVVGLNGPISKAPSVSFVNEYIKDAVADDIYYNEDWTQVNVDFTVTGDTAKYVRLSVEAGHFEGKALISDFRLAPHEIDPDSSEEDSDFSAPAPDTSKDTPDASDAGSGTDTPSDSSAPAPVDTGVASAAPAALILTAVSVGAVLTLRRRRR